MNYSDTLAPTMCYNHPTMNTFKTLGAMLDVSRGRVATVPFLQERFRRLRQMGYNAVMLYAEDVFQLPGEPKWGYMRGGYSADEIRVLKAEADALGLEMIPCVETLGHLEQPLRWPDYAAIRNTPSTLLVGEEATYALIDKILAFWQETVGGHRIHLGMDEAGGFAGGKYAAKNGQQPPIDVFIAHLERVNALCAAHGFDEPIIWSDMIYRMASAKHDYYDPAAKADPALAARLPKNMRLCYWDYYHDTRDYFEGMIDGHRSLGSEPILAGGAQVWFHFLHDREKTLATTAPFVEAGLAKGCGEFFVTVWGDDGGYAIPGVVDEALFTCAELAAGRTAEPNDDNCARFRAITGLDYRSLAKLGEVTRHYADEWPDMILEASVLYDDPLYCGNYRNYLLRKPSETTDRRFYCAHYRDAAWRDDGEKVLADHRRVLAECAGLPGVPPAADALVRVLGAKLAYEANVLAAWRAKDRDVLAHIAAHDLPDLIARMEAFCELFREDWYATSKPFGFERIQKRNAAALARLVEAHRRLADYLAGKDDTIPEFDEAMQPLGHSSARTVCEW